MCHTNGILQNLAMIATMTKTEEFKCIKSGLLFLNICKA